MAGSMCLVTVHEIGFQRAPDDDARKAGYADGLHEHLRGFLGDESSRLRWCNAPSSSSWVVASQAALRATASLE
jgi:hypothetical protein